MSQRFVFCLIVYTFWLEKFSNAEFQYMGIKNVNQMEAPSLESQGMMAGMGGGDGPESFASAGFAQNSAANYGAGDKDCKKEKSGATNFATNFAANEEPEGWKEINMGRMIPKKKCVNSKFRSLDPTVTPNIRIIDRKREESPLKVVKRVHMKPEDDEIKTYEKDLKPNMRERIETYTEKYVVTSIKTLVKTRRRLFMQKRKVINQKMNEPIMIIRRKVINERQIFERIIPKIVETREIINKPSFKSRVIEGPIYEVTTEALPQVLPRHALRPQDCNIPEVEFNPNQGMNQEEVNYGMAEEEEEDCDKDNQGY